MYKILTKVQDLSSLRVDESTYEQFKKNVVWHRDYVEKLENEGYKPEYISFSGSEIISTQYISTFWLMALKIIQERYLENDSHIIPNGISIEAINSEISPKNRTNQKWLVPINYVSKCDICIKLFDKDCSCIK